LPFENDEKLMKTTLIYNPQSGPGFSPRPEEILNMLRKIGHDPTHVPTASEIDLDRALAEVEDLVVVAGGDGTIRAVALRLLGRDVKIAPVPMGTANNIAHLLALTGNPLEIVAGLADPIQKALDIGHVQTPDGSASTGERTSNWTQSANTFVGRGTRPSPMSRVNPTCIPVRRSARGARRPA
jgi:diacylglycerol kinase family enzyme